MHLLERKRGINNMKIALNIFFVILSIIMFFWSAKTVVVGAEVLEDAGFYIPFVYFFALFCWHTYNNFLEIQRLEYEIEYLNEVIKESKEGR